MKRGSLYLIVVAAVLLAASSKCVAEEWGSDPSPIATEVDSTLEVEVKEAVSVLADTRLESRLPSRKQRRAMGVTFRNIRLKLVEMKKSGQLDDMGREEVSVAVLNELVLDNPQAFQNAAIDWDAILAFIERLIPLLLLLFGGLG